ncbi:MAG: hypothetical protein SGPRY_011200 [Prymnesium sp.]
MADELERQARRLQAEHEAEMRRHLAQIRAVHSTEVSGLRAQLTSAREDAAQQRYEAERAASECAIEVERERVEREAAQRGELARMRSRNSLLEAALGKVAPLVPAVCEHLAHSHEASPLLAELRTAQTALEAVFGVASSPPSLSRASPPHTSRPPPLPPVATSSPTRPIAVDVPPAALPSTPHPQRASSSALATFPPNHTTTPPDAQEEPAKTQPAPPRSRWAAAEARLTLPEPPAPPHRAEPPGMAASVSVRNAQGKGGSQPLARPQDQRRASCGSNALSSTTKPPKPSGSLPLPPGSKGVAAPPPARPSRSEPPKPPPPKPPPQSGARLTATYLGYTHPGGSKPADATNQDTWFVHEIDQHNMLFAVFDGHGPENGMLVAQVAAKTVQEYVVARFSQLSSTPETVFSTAFELAHNAVLDAVLQARLTNSDLKLVDGVPVDMWMDENGVQQIEVADGGTTATVIALVDGATLIYAQEPTKSAPSTQSLRSMVLMGFQDRLIPSVSFSAAAFAQVTFEELMAEHSATNPEEYTRVQSHPRGRQLQFVYDTPELIDEGKAPAVFKKVNGSFQLDVGARRLAEVGCLSSIFHLPLHESVVHNTVAKNARGDLPAIILTPEEPGFEQQ